MRTWLISLIREAVRAEVADHFQSLEGSSVMIEQHFAEMTSRVKERQDEKKKPLPTIGKQWGSRARELEAQSGNNG